MEYSQAIGRVQDTVVKLRYLECMDNLLYCDRWNVCPPGGFSYQTNVGAYLAELRHDQLDNSRVRELVEHFAGFSSEDYASDLDRGMVRYLTERYQEAVQIPAELLAQLNRANAEGQQAWEECFQNDDFQSFKPYLKRQFEVQRRIAEAIDPNQPPYQVLVNRFDRGYTLAEIDEVFATLKPAIRKIMEKAVPACAGVDASVLHSELDKAGMQRLGRRLQELMGFDWNQGVMYEAHHPVCVCVGPRDSRPSANYEELFHSLVATAHETGHGIYSYNSEDAVVKAGLWGGLDGAMHESQSKFYENLVLRSPELWQAFYPELQREDPHFAAIPMEQVRRAFNRVMPGPRRLLADELTVPLHVIIRYELERDYFEGRLTVDQMEEAWNAKYKEYLGLEPANRQEGILQDVHWASGCVGYFQGYVLGEIYASQFRHKLVQDVPDAYERLARGDIGGINGWLKEHVHRYGQTYSAKELLKKATGEDMNIQYYIQHLQDAFLP